MIVNRFQEIPLFIQRFQSLFEDPFYINDECVYIGSSVGISIYPDNGREISELLRNADITMYRAKKSEQGNVYFYSNDLTESTVRRWSIENELREAIEKNDFILLYQPKVCSQTQLISAVEALIRLLIKNNTSVYLSEFIPIAEETRLIIQLGK